MNLIKTEDAIPDLACKKEDCFLCRNVSKEWMEIVRMKRSIFKYKKGDIIFRELEDVKGIFFILHGKVKIFMSWGSEKDYLVRLAGDGKILGHRGYGLQARYPVSAEALEETEVCFIENELFWKLVRTNPDLHFELTQFYADELKRTEQRLKHMACTPVKCRVAESLILVHEAFGANSQGMLNYKISRKDLASMAGTTYESVVRMLSELQSDGLIMLNNKSIVLVRLNDLKKLCGFNEFTA